MRVRAFSSCVGLLLACARPGFAQAQPPAVWYRASEACPNGARFLEKLAENSRQARLAQAGDHIDFVVTLVADNKETVGRLERQTNSGSVAIRELHDATCEQVADALALSLGLALTPGQPSAEGVVQESEEESSVLGDGTATAASPVTSPPTPPPAPEAIAPSPAPPVSHPDVPEPKARWSLGLEFGPMIGISTHPLPRGGVFADFRPALGHVLPNLSVRGSIVGVWGSSETAIGPVQRWIVAGRAEACPVAWGAGRVDLRPCLGFELGATGASAEGGSGVDDRSLWAAPAGQLRLAVALLPERIWLEASGGVLVPLIRNEIFSGSQSLYRDAPAAFHAHLGLSLRLP